MQIVLDQEKLKILQDKSKLLSYLNTAFTKTYFSIGDGKFILFFKGVKGAAKFVIPIEKATEKACVFQIDYSKWLNALAKFNIFTNAIYVTLTEKSLTLKAAGGMTGVISLGIIPYDSDSPEVDVLNNFIESNWKEDKKITINEDIADAISISLSVLTPASKNNAIALTQNSVLYADRSIVLKSFCSIPPLPADCPVEMHRYSAGFILQAWKQNPEFFFSSDFSTINWKSSDGMLSCILAGEPCEIVIPTEEEIQAIKPKGNASITIEDHRDLVHALELFNGFYEASVWKPIKFTLTKNKGLQLEYKHPTIEIQKDLEVPVSEDGDFILSSENLSKLLDKASEKNNWEGVPVVFQYDEESLGVSCSIGAYFDVIFAKLST